MELTERVKIVIVDDDEKIASLSGQSLESKGYNVEVFSKPVEALEFIKNNAEYNILITDNIMPELNGQDLIKKVLELRDDMSFILATGDDNSDIGDIKNHEKVCVLAKPFRRKDLITAIGKLFDA